MIRILFIFLAFTNVLCAQGRRYEEDVQTIKKYDEMYAPAAHPVLFTGSSSIRKWDDLERTFGAYNAMNRGIGGAIVNDISNFTEELIFSYHPRQVIIYVGENDLPLEGTTADSVLQRVKRLYTAIRSRLPQTPIAYISIKPSPSRVQYIETAAKANDLIREFLSKEANTRFINIYPLMLDSTGKPRQELFVSDMLHMNARGYAIWRKAILPYLVKP
ncbi:GDSL-type esterase/lipase family protein [Chitinophaga solisilvae]|uniref:GDSL-type esterase/lipase family protein n=1 Tax=Chitinophaga solisilvae TaxID=1233460 RepID=UPI001369E0F0|nr:GDSL-type esterase/lipase family protein [Chitinophaga solisilvae]